MNKNFLSKNLLGLAALAIGVALVIGFVVASDSTDDTTTNNTSSQPETSDDAALEDTVPEIDSDVITQDEIETDSTPIPEEEIPGAVNAKDTLSLTTAEVANHSSASDCWMIINGSVYDVTSYIANHPGGDIIASECGGDGTAAFNTGVNDEGESVKAQSGHSPNADAQLAGFLLGPLED